jgi:hypothetical protein
MNGMLSHTARFRTRRAFTVLEVSVSTVLLLVVMSLAAQTLGLVIGQRLETERRQWALQQAVNVMDRLTVLPWENLSTDQATEVASATVSAAISELPNGSVNVQIDDQTDGPADCKRVVVEVGWRSRPGQVPAPVRLTCWRFRTPGAGK